MVNDASGEPVDFDLKNGPFDVSYCPRVLASAVEPLLLSRPLWLSFSLTTEAQTNRYTATQTFFLSVCLTLTPSSFVHPVVVDALGRRCKVSDCAVLWCDWVEGVC